ncbi:hypothetical protein CPC16_009669 [Podila verticillata]|nr:hypothetical protein CPC16_009669 [Podila verticillata]
MHAGTKPMRWIALGSLAIMMLHGTFADKCPSPTTVTKTETTTIFADGSWPTATVTQFVQPDNCPPEPRYSCYIVSTTIVSTPFPKATIHMVLPQHVQLRHEQEEVDWDAESKEDSENYDDDEEPQGDIHEKPTPTITVLNLPVSNAPTGPACVHYVTAIGLAACPTFTPLPTNSDGCAIVTSTSFALTAATAVPEKPLLNDDIDMAVTYSYSIDPEPTHHHKHRHHRKRPKPTITPVPKLVPDSIVSSPIPQLDNPIEVDTAFSTEFSTHYSYTLSFDFNYGIIPPPSLAAAYPELPGPTSPPGVSVTPPPAPTSTPSSDPPPVADLVTPALAPAPAPEPMPPVPTPDTTTPPVVIPPPGPTPAADPLIGASDGYDVDPIDPLDAVDPPSDPPSPITTSSADPLTEVDPSLGLTPVHKACDACAEPCVVDVEVVANAEVPLLVRLFQDKVKSALVSLRLSLENETGASATENGAAGVFGKLSLKANAETAGLFRQACETKLQEMEDRQLARLSAKAEQVVGSTCETGACLQGEVDKAVKLLDFMVSTELARDASQLRVDLVNEFRTKCAEEDKKRVLALSVNADATLKKRSGLLGNLLGSVVGGNLDKVVDQVGHVVGDVVGQVSPLLGDLVKGLIDALTSTVKSVVDSFVGNCNRKGLLDFDTEHGVGSLAAIANVSVDLFKLVCVKANADVKVDASMPK